MIAGADFVHYLLSGAGVILVFVIAAIVLQRQRASARTRRVVLAVAIVYVLLANYALQLAAARLLVGNLRPFEPADLPKGGRVAIVVLGSGSKTVENWSGARYSTVDRTAAARVFEAYRVYQIIHPDLVISSGGEPHPEIRHEPSGATMRDALVQLGIPRDRIAVEIESKTTRGNALSVAPILKSKRIDRVVLVTSEVHMRRSLGTFKAAGIDAVPAIAQELEPLPSATFAVLPSEVGIDAGIENVHEVLGIVYYRLRGWWKP